MFFSCSSGDQKAEIQGLAGPCSFWNLRGITLASPSVGCLSYNPWLVTASLHSLLHRHRAFLSLCSCLSISLFFLSVPSHIGSGPTLLQHGLILCVCLVVQLCLTLCDPMGSSVHGDSPGKNTGVGCHFLLQGIFLAQGPNPSLLYLMHWQVESLLLSPREAPWLISIRIMSQPAQYNRANRIWQDRKYDHKLRPSGDGNILTCTERVREMALESRIQGFWCSNTVWQRSVCVNTHINNVQQATSKWWLYFYSKSLIS